MTDKTLANWLTAPEQQIKAFKAKGAFPSQTAALIDPELLGHDPRPVQGPDYFAINDARQSALSRVDVDQTDDAATSWATFEQDVSNLGG